MTAQRAVLIISLIIMLLLPAPGKAENEVKPAPPKAQLVEKRLVMGKTVYRFMMGPYNPMAYVKFVEKKDADYRTPEKALVTHLSAMQALDMDWARKSWDSASLAYMDDADKRGKITRQDWINRWKELTGRPHFINFRAELTSGGKKYTLIAYTADLGPEKQGPFSFVPMRQQGGRWYLTQELRRHPVMRYLQEFAGSDADTLDKTPEKAATPQTAKPLKGK